MRKDKKAFALALALFLIIFASGFLVLSDYGLMFFNAIFGNKIYVLKIICTPSPTYQMGKIIGVGYTFDIKLTRDKIPVEAALVGYRVEKHQGENIGVSWRLHILAYVLNHVKIFDRTITFDDLNRRTIWVYLKDVPPEARQVYVEIDGSYYLEGQELNFSGYGGVFPFET